MAKDSGSGLLIWLLKQGGVSLVHPKHRDNKGAFASC
jgi:hypothetical protein